MHGDAAATEDSPRIQDEAAFLEALYELATLTAHLGRAAGHAEAALRARRAALAARASEYAGVTPGAASAGGTDFEAPYPDFLLVYDGYEVELQAVVHQRDAESGHLVLRTEDGATHLMDPAFRHLRVGHREESPRIFPFDGPRFELN